MVCDVMTGIKARGKGVFIDLVIILRTSFVKKVLHFQRVILLAEVIPGNKKVGWSFPFKIPMYGKF